ncbi:MAG TPA: sugar phosphate isomerase/epimerase [Armatimonadota bacterium]|jgi:sugar phosphate isomerase/epimerase
MQIACSTLSLHRDIPRTLPLLSFPAWCGSQGIASIEVVDTQLPSLEPEFLGEFQRACAHAGVSLSCLALSNDFTLPDPDQLFAQVERVRQILYDIAMPLHIPVVRVFIGMADTTRAGDQRALEAFRGLVTDLKVTGVTLALENHGRVETTAAQTMALITGVNSPHFGSCLDFGNLPPERRYDAIAQLAPFAKHVHAKSYAFDAQGEETMIDYKRALATLTEFAYDGVIAIEYEGRDDAHTGILATKTLIEKYWEHPEAERGSQAA